LNPMPWDSLKIMMINPSGKLRLIYLWEIQSAVSVNSFPDFVSINRMYRDRDFELITVGMGEPADKEQMLRFLQKQEASNVNYLISTNDNNNLMKFINSSSQGGFPYTLLVEPGGKIVYAKEGAVDAAVLKTIIVNNNLLGRFP
jgi:hypothetical protein